MDTSMTTVQTVLGPVSADSLGAVDAHEHLFLRSFAMPGDEFTDTELMLREVENVRGSGIDTIVDLTPIGLGRDPVGLADVSARSGVHVVAATGFHRDAHYPEGHVAYVASDDVLLDAVLADLRDGMDALDGSRTDIRAGIIKLGASYQRISPAEQRRLSVGAEAARVTGVPVAVHCEIGTMATEILDALAHGGIPAERVALCHMDRNPDPELHASLCARGAYLIYDTIGRVKYAPDSARLDLIARLVELGHVDRLLLGTDVGRRSMLRSYGGGPGMDVLGRDFLPRLTKRVGDDVVARLIRTNPAGFLGGSAG
jgi:phosphotriesterase-related protein